MKQLTIQQQKVIAELCETPGDFIRVICAINNMTCTDFWKTYGVSSAYGSLLFTNKANGGVFGVKVCVKLSKFLNIDPHILYDLASKYTLELELKKEKQL